MQEAHHSRGRSRFVALLVGALLLAGCQRTPEVPGEAPAADTPVAAPVASTDLSPLLDAMPTCALEGWYIDQ